MDPGVWTVRIHLSRDGHLRPWETCSNRLERWDGGLGVAGIQSTGGAVSGSVFDPSDVCLPFFDRRAADSGGGDRVGREFTSTDAAPCPPHTPDFGLPFDAKRGFGVRRRWVRSRG